MHPLVGELSQYRDAELEERISKLSNSYFQTNNEHARRQIAMLLDDYNEELNNRRSASITAAFAAKQTSIDALLNIR